MDLIGICLITNDVLALAKFYSEILGVEFEGDDTHMELKRSGVNIAIFSVEGMGSMAPNSMCGAGHGSIIITFEVKDVDAEYERLKSFDIEFIKLPITHPWGARSMWFRDLDGNIVNFVTILKNN